MGIPRGRKPKYSEPLNERITTEFTSTIRKAIREKCRNRSEAEYIRSLVCQDLGLDILGNRTNLKASDSGIS